MNDSDNNLRFYECTCGNKWHSRAISVSQKCRKREWKRLPGGIWTHNQCGKAWTGELVAEVPMVEAEVNEDGVLEIRFRDECPTDADVQSFLEEELRLTFSRSKTSWDGHLQDMSIFSKYWYVHRGDLLRKCEDLARGATSRMIRKQYEKEIYRLKRKIELTEKAAALILLFDSIYDQGSIAALVRGKVDFNVDIHDDSRVVRVQRPSFLNALPLDDTFLESIFDAARDINESCQVLPDERNCNIALMELCECFNWIKLMDIPDRSWHATESCYVCRFTKASCLTSLCYSKSKYGKFDEQKLYVRDMFQEAPWPEEEEAGRRANIEAYFQELGEKLDDTRGVNMATVENPERDIQFIRNSGAFTIRFKSTLIAHLVIEHMESNQTEIATKLRTMRKSWIENDGDDSVPGILYFMTMCIPADVSQELLQVCQEDSDCVGRICFNAGRGQTVVNLFARPDVLKQKAAELRLMGKVKDLTYKRVIEPVDVLDLGWDDVQIGDTHVDLPMKDIPCTGDHAFEEMCVFFEKYCQLNTWSDMKSFVDKDKGFGRCQAGSYDPLRNRNRRGRRNR